MKKVLFLIFASLLVLGACWQDEDKNKEDDAKKVEVKKTKENKKDKQSQSKEQKQEKPYNNDD